MDNKIGVYFWVRVGVMIAALVGVLLLMKRMNTSGGLDFFGAGSASQSVNLCPTRVTSVSVIGRFAIIQDGLKWYRAEGGDRVELDPVAVEKWFGAYCTVPTTPEPTIADGAPLLTLAYVSGLPATLLMSTEGVFTFDRVHFRSLELLQAITALEQLPKATIPGQNSP